MMRITNSMIVKRTKTNINTNRAKVDYTNNQMSTQKKITKPSDDPIIAIRSLRLRSTLSTVTQYYERNIPDTESWMDCTQTALVNMKDLLTDAYKQTVYGTNDSLNTDNRRTILKELQALQQQVYCEGNADYAGRTVFTGYKTNQKLTFSNNIDAREERYQIEERFTYKDIEKKNYYAGQFDDTSSGTLLDPANPVPVFNEVGLNRIRLSYDNITAGGDALAQDRQNTLSISYITNPVTKETNTIELSSDGSKIGLQGCTFEVGQNTAVPPQDVIQVTAPDGYFADPSEVPLPTTAGTTTTITTTLRKSSDWTWDAGSGSYVPAAGVTNPETKSVSVDYTVPNAGAGDPYFSANITTPSGTTIPLSYKVTNTSELKDTDYQIDPEDQIVFDAENGELIFTNKLAKAMDELQVSFNFTYDKEGFEEGELRPEYYFNCTRYMTDRKPIVYENFDLDGNWMEQAIYYNVAGGQQMQINTEARDVFNSDIRRDMDELIDIVQMSITAQETVESIEKKISTEQNLTDADKKKLNQWLDAAKKQRDYANQNMHDTYSAYITKFQGYLDTVDLTITDLGGRGERVELTKNRMNIQQSTFKELKSINEDMDLSELVINYTSASVAYQAALQAAAKIGKMTLLDFI